MYEVLFDRIKIYESDPGFIADNFDQVISNVRTAVYNAVRISKDRYPERYKFTMNFEFNDDVTRYAVAPTIARNEYYFEIYITLTSEQLGEWMVVKAEKSYA
jgi:hypothetical protein